MKAFKESAIGIFALIIMVMIVGTVYAGSLTAPAGTVTSQSYTLSDIYNKLVTGASAGGHSVSAQSSVNPTFRTLTDVWDKIPDTLVISADSVNVPVGINRTATTLNSIDTDLTPSKIKLGETIFGVTGTYTGSGGGPITLQWSRPFTGLTGPAGMTNFTNTLCWDANPNLPTPSTGQYPCTLPQFHGTPSGTGGGLYDNNGITIGAVEYCAYLNVAGTALTNTPNNYWRLPTRAELYAEFTRLIVMEADQAELHNVFPMADGRSAFLYWSSDQTTLDYGGRPYPAAFAIGAYGAGLGEPADWFYDSIRVLESRKKIPQPTICVK